MISRLNRSLAFRILFSLLSILCMILIFLFSCENGEASSDTSGEFTQIAAETFVDDFDSLSHEKQESVLSEIDHIIRKTAHFSIYAALGFCVSCAFGRRKLITAFSGAVLLICFAYACSDELHQYFVPERSCRFTDVLIDTAGSITGILISIVFMNICSYFIRKRKNKINT
ncbi:MAG: VanZ family protein [Ruminococcus sp.]|nr:VanZ family protein [Ruminococcus sp.]